MLSETIKLGFLAKGNIAIAFKSAKISKLFSRGLAF